MAPFNLTEEEKATLKQKARKWRVTPGPPVITIFVRHSPDCRYRGDEFCKRCDCPKHLPWSQHRKQHCASAHTRSWAIAEEKKREIEDQLAGRKPVTETPQVGTTISAAVDLFMQAKRNDGLETPTLQKLQKTCDRIRDVAEAAGVFTLDGITLVHLTNWPWSRYFNTTHSLRTNQERGCKYVCLHSDSENPK